MAFPALTPTLRRLLAPLGALLMLTALGAAPAHGASPASEAAAAGAAELSPQTERAYARLAARKATGRVVNGDPISISSAPYQVVVWSGYRDGNGIARLDYYCGGSLISATTVVTAAHCVMDKSKVGLPPESGGLGVWAGISHLDEGFAPSTDVFQSRDVDTARVHPAFKKNLVVSTGDLAVLELDVPIDLSEPGVATIPVAPESPAADGERILPGPEVVLTGFGRQSASADPNGGLFMLRTNVVGPDSCPESHRASTGIVSANSGELCAITSTGFAGNSCSGDSGGPLVTAGLNPVLVGVVSNGPTECDAGGWSGYADVTVPEHAVFLAGNNNPPVAPRQLESIQIGLTSPIMPIDQPITCKGGAWAPVPTRIKWVVSTSSGTRLASGDGPEFKYVVKKSDAGLRLRCRAYASNAGGVQVTRMVEAPLVPVPEPGGRGGTPVGTLKPKVSRLVTPRKVKRGKAYSVTLTFTGVPPSATIAKASLTVSGWKVIGGTTRFQQSAGGGGTLSFKYRVAKKAKRGKVVKFGVKAAFSSKAAGSTTISALGSASASVKIRVK